jgi:hypothetical protein
MKPCFLLHEKAISIGELQLGWKFVTDLCEEILKHFKCKELFREFCNNTCLHGKNNGCHFNVIHNLTQISQSSYIWLMCD